MEGKQSPAILLIFILSIPLVFASGETIRRAAKSTESSTWLVTEWSECSARCGGVRVRSVHCVDRYGLASEMCHSHKPINHQLCSKDKCNSTAIGAYPQQYWQNRGLKEVLTNAGREETSKNKRTITHFKAVTKKLKVVRQREALEWTVSDWSECSATCGGGFRVRSVRCLDECGIISPLNQRCNTTKSSRPSTYEFCAQTDCITGIMNGSILPPSQTFNSSIPDGSRSILDFSSSSVELYEINQNITEVDGTVTILMKTGNMTISCYVRPVDITITLVQSMGQNVLFTNGEFLFLFDCIKTTIIQFEQMVMYENSTVTILGRNTTFPNITTFWYCDSFRCYKFSSSKSFLRSGPPGKLFTSKEVALYSIASLVNRAIEDILANPPLISFSTPVATMITTSPTIIISSSTFLTSSILTTVMSSEETTLITPSLTKDTFDLSTLTSLPIPTVLLTPTVLVTPTPTVGPDIVEPTSDEPSPSTRKPEKTKTKIRTITHGKTKTTIKICTLSKTRNTETKSTEMTFTGRTTKTRMTDMVKGSKDGVTVTKCTTMKTVGSTRDTTAKSKGTISRTRGSMETTRSTTTRRRGGKETTRSTTRRRGGKETTRSTTRRRGGMGTTRSTTTRRRGGMGTTRSTTTRRRGGMGTTRGTKGVVGTTKSTIMRISELCRTKVTDKRTWSKVSRCIEVHLTKSATTDDDATDIRTFDSSNSMKRPGGAKKLHLKTTFVNTLRALLVDLKKAGMMQEREIDAQHSFDEMDSSPSKYLRMKNKSKPHASAISQEDPFLKHKFVVENVFSGRTFTHLSSKPSFHKPCTLYPPKLLAAQASSKPVLYEVLLIYVYDHDEEQGCLISCLDPEKQYEAFLWSESEDHQNGAEVQKSISIALDPEVQEQDTDQE